MPELKLRPSGITRRPDPARVLLRPFIPGDAERIRAVIQRALALTEEETEQQMAVILADFGSRHLNLPAVWHRHYGHIARHVPTGSPELTEARQLYLGALFSGEYALESAALFNPSMVPHPDQSGLPPGALRFVLSLRATGEGHISSIEFRTGTITAALEITLEEPSRMVTAPTLNPNPTYRKSVFLDKLAEMGFANAWSTAVLGPLARDFTLAELEGAMQRAAPIEEEAPREDQRTRECVHWLAKSNYEVEFGAETSLSERAIFPVSANESNGIEDARFVRFTEEDGSTLYYATYTAYNGHAILPQLLETTDFRHFRARTLNGRAVQNKGMAFFPRRVGGRYAMLSRQDDEKLFLMFSDNPHFWSEPQLLRRPRYPWETVKIGNCGSPLETPHGWLVITHGVGPMRQYSLGAILLDLEDPARVIGELSTPLVRPTGNEREGYVPNVVYTCGALLHAGSLVLPYGLSDSATTIGTMPLAELLGAMKQPT